MLITPSNLNLFFTALEGRFWMAYGIAPLFADKMATVIPVSTEQVAFGWIGMVDKMREWLGPRTVHSPAPQTYSVTMQNFELTESVDRFKLEDDNFGVYAPLFDFMGKSARKNPDYQMRDLLKNQGSQTGTRQNGPDGLTGFNTAHPIDLYDSSKGTYCNDFTGGGVSIGGITVGGALSVTPYLTVRQEMMSRKSESGEALGVMPDLLSVAPQLDSTAKTLLQASFLAPASLGGLSGQVGPMDNVAMRGTAELLTVPEFASDPNVWYLSDTSKALRPLIWCERQAPNFIARTRLDDPAVFDSHVFLFGSDSRGAPAWGPSFLISRSGP